MKKIFSILLSVLIIFSAFSFSTAYAKDKTYASFDEIYGDNEFVEYADDLKMTSAVIAGEDAKFVLVKFTPNVSDGYVFTLSWKGAISSYSCMGMDIPFTQGNPSFDNIVLLSFSNTDLKNNSQHKTSVCLKKGVTYYFVFALGTSGEGSVKIDLCSHARRKGYAVAATLFNKGESAVCCCDCGKVFSKETMPKEKYGKIKVSAKKKSIVVKYPKAEDGKGYQIQYAANKKFTKGKKTINIKGSKNTKKQIKKLKSKKKYYVRVRAYDVSNGKKVYSTWSNTKAVKVK